MLSLEQQVTSLELSKKLKSLNVKQESYFDWYLWDDEEYTTRIVKSSPMYRYSMRDYCSAFTVAELGEMLYNAGAKNFMKAYGDVFGFPGTAFVGDLGVMNLMRKPDMSAKMLIYLLENNLIELPK